MFIKLGENLPHFSLPSMGGDWVSSAQFYGRKTLYFLWASWSNSRENLPVLHDFYKKNKFNIVAIAFDVRAHSFPMIYLKKYNVTFTNLLDNYCLLSRLWGVKKIPLFIFCDEKGYVLLISEGSAETVIKKIASLRIAKIKKQKSIKKISQDTVPETQLQHVTNLLGRGYKKDALELLKKVWLKDRDNLIIKSQIEVIKSIQ